MNNLDELRAELRERLHEVQFAVSNSVNGRYVWLGLNAGSALLSALQAAHAARMSFPSERAA